MRRSRVVDLVAGKVARRCEAELAQCGQHVMPLRVTIGDDDIPGDLLGETVAGHASNRLILLGGPGAGKTLLVAGLVGTILARRQSSDVVPLFLPLSTWRPGQSLCDWAAQLVGEVSSAELQELSKQHGIVWALDGLGESSQPTAAGLLHILRDLPAGDGLVLSCRPDAYRELAAAGPPPDRVVLAKVRPLDPGDVAAWLAGVDRIRWEPVITELTQHPTGAVAEALSTPETLQLARSAYAHTGDLGELVAHGDSRARVEGHLVDQFETTVDPEGRQRARLALLARHLHRLNTRDLGWWKLPSAVPEAVRGLVAQLGAGLLLGAAFGLVVGAAPAFWFGLGFGLSFGLQGWPTGGRGGSIAWRTVIVTMFTLALSEVYHPIAGIAVGIVIGLLAWRGYGRAMGLGIGLGALAASALAAIVDANAVWATVVGAFLAFTTGVVFWAVFAESRVRPSRTLARPSRAVRSFLIRFAAGFAASAVPTVIVALTGRAGVAVALAIGTASGLAAGITVWLDAPGSIYLERPHTTLAQDRAAALLAGVATGIIVGTGLCLTLVLFDRLSQSTAYDTAFSVRVGIVGGLAAGVAITFSRAWGALVLARVWFGLTGRLPRRVMACLADMHAAGMFIESGGAYRFRFRSHEERLRSPASRVGGRT